MTATIDDVTPLIDTDLTGVEIQPLLDLTVREVSRSYSADKFEDTDHKRDFEAALTAFRLTGGLDRRPERVSVGTSTVSFDESERSFLRGLVAVLDPGSEFGPWGVTRLSARNYGSANNPREDSRITQSDRQ